MRNLTIAFGKGRTAKIWQNKTISFEDLKKLFSTPIRSNETVAEYQSFSKSERDKAKDTTGFVMGKLTDGLRRIDTVEYRSALCLDADKATPEFVVKLPEICRYTAIVYSTHSHVYNKPRLRLVIPLMRDITPEEYGAISRYTAQELGLEFFDECSFRPNQFMYLPSCPKDAEYIFFTINKNWLVPDEILKNNLDWTDFSRLPKNTKEEKAINNLPIKASKQQDPLTKRGIIGAFCKTYYPIQKAMSAFLSNVYEPTGDNNRWHLIDAKSVAGVEVYEDRFTYSHHAKDPAYMRLCNAYDLVKIHKFGTDAEAEKAMQKWASGLSEVKNTISKIRNADLNNDFSEIPENLKPAKKVDTRWESELEYTQKTFELKNTLHNIRLILENDENLKNFAYNEFTDFVEVTGDTPWRRSGKFWREQDEAQLLSYIEKKYGCTFSQRNFDIAFTQVTDDRAFHPVKNYFKNLPAWDNLPRAESVFIDYLGAENNAYTRAVTRKILCAAYKRIFDPGCKFDYMVVLNGPQGIGKSTLISKLAGEWFSDSLTLSDMQDKTAAEKLQGYWILELGEMAGIKKAEVEKVKGFISRQNDIYRPAFGRRVKPFLRQCIFIGTTNADDGYLRDTTGNRRFWNINVSGGVYSPFELDKDIVAQIWAEVAVLAQNEDLYLSAEIAEIANKEACKALEKDDREGLIRNYLDKDLPYNWDNLNIYDRREFLNNQDSIGFVKREKVSVIEIWCECFEKDKADLNRHEANQIVRILQIIGWEKEKKVSRLKIYGPQGIFVKRVL